MKNRILFLLIAIIIPFISNAQVGDTLKNKYYYKSPVYFLDSVKANGLFGTGTVLRIDEDGYIYKSSGTSIDTIPIGQVLGLQDSLAKFQEIITTDSNFVFTANKLDLNDTIWADVVKSSNRVEILDNIPQLRLEDENSSVDNKNIAISLDQGELKFQYLRDNGSGGGRFIKFERNDNSLENMQFLQFGIARIKLKTDGTGVFEDTVRSGQLKAAGLLYPLSDGTNGQVIKTDGSGVLSFTEAASLLTAGDNITISNDTISATAATDSDWTTSGGDVYNSTDNIGIGLVSPNRKLDVAGQSRFTSSGNPAVEVIQSSAAASALNVTSASGTGITIESDAIFGDGIRLNSYGVDSITNDTLLRTNSLSQSALVTEYAVKKNEVFNRKNNTRLSWAADVDTSARVNGFVIKWNDATKTHYYDTAGTGGGGSSYFAAAGLELSGSNFSIGTDSVSYDMIQNVGANSVLANNTASAADVAEVSLGLEQLLGRGDAGNVAPITLGAGLSMTGTTLSASGGGSGGGDITAVTAGDGLTGGATSGVAILNVGAGDGIDAAANSVAVDVTDILGDGLTETSNNITLGTPSGISTSSTNLVTGTTHTHLISYAPADAFTYYLDTSGTAQNIVAGQGMSIDSTEDRVICRITDELGDTLILDNGYYMVSIKATVRVTSELNWGGKSNYYEVKLFKTNTTYNTGGKVADTGEILTANAKQNSNAQLISIEEANPVYADEAAYLTISTHPVKVLIGEGANRLYATIKSSKNISADYVDYLGATMQVTRVREYNPSLEQQNE